MAAKVGNAILVDMDSGDLYFIVRVLTKGCLTYKYQVYLWNPETAELILMARKANKIMKEMLDESLIAYPQVALGDKKNSSTVQTGNILWEHLDRGAHYRSFNPKDRASMRYNTRLSKIYGNGRRKDRGKTKE